MASTSSSNKTKKSKSTASKSTGKSSGSASRRSSSAHASVPPASAPPEQMPIRREVWGIIFSLLAIFTIISYFNTEGRFIVGFTNLVKGLIGWGFWLLAPCLLLCAGILFLHRGRPVAFRLFSALLLPFLFGSLIHLFRYVSMPYDDLREFTNILFEQGISLKSGGAVSGLLAYGLQTALSGVGAAVVLIIAFLFFLLHAFNSGFIDIGKALVDRHNNRPAYDPAQYPAQPAAAKPKARLTPLELDMSEPRKTPAAQSPDVPAAETPARSSARKNIIDIPLGDDDDIITPFGVSSSAAGGHTSTPKAAKNAAARKKDTPAVQTENQPRTVPVHGATTFVEPVTIERAAEISGINLDSSGKMKAPTPTETPDRPAAVRTSPAVKRIEREEINKEAESVAAEIGEKKETAQYQYPPLDLLRASAAVSIDARDEISANRERLEAALHSFGIPAAIVNIIRGPTVTRYDIELQQGVKLAKVTNLAGDLALALGAINVRIAPIPDKISTVGIEVPNKIVSTVYLRDIIDSDNFRNAKSKISFALGKDIGGNCIVGNIAKLPHLLIAGTTGSGKSVCMNSLILSILYKSTPDEAKFIMVDPKMVELGIYNGIPHLLVPVVTDPKKAAGALQWSVVEMLKRYRLFSEMGVRDLDTYNSRAVQEGKETMPKIIVVIDELADLMLVAAKEVEESICRVAQMGRAAGMHLVIATQRPSADVITGLMKANIPSRIAFAVSSSLESRIILDQAGAEKLIGMGDMLYSPVGSGKPLRIQGAFVSDEEREEVITFIKENSGAAEHNEEISAYMDKAVEAHTKSEEAESKGKGGSASADGDSLASNYDETLPQAVEVVLEMKACSVSMLQRRLKLGYSRAARVVDQLEELGVVGPYEGAKPRSVTIDRDGWNQLQVKLGLASADDFAAAAEMSQQSDDMLYDEDTGE